MATLLRQLRNVAVTYLTQESKKVRHPTAMAVHHVQSDTLLHDRAVFISGMHLGAECRLVERFLDLFRDFDTQKIYQGGGITDRWPLQHGWPQAHNGVVLQNLHRRTQKGGRLIYIPGNHDEFLQEAGTHCAAIAVPGVAVHVAIVGERDISGGEWIEHGTVAAEMQGGECEVMAWTPSCRSIGASQARAA